MAESVPPNIGSLRLAPLPGAVPAWRATVDSDGLRRACEAVARGGGRLGALWASDERDRGAGFALHAVLVAFEGLVCVDVRLEGETYADVSDIFPAAGRMQRAIADLMGLRTAVRDTRGWLRHGAWRENAFPLRRDVALDARLAAGDPRYAFVPVEGEGVHEIPVGPVHAGIIEPGHFRFSVVGERVLRLEERLGYAHKGVEKRFESLSLEEAARLAARVSGDSSVAFSWAYAMALETAAACKVPERALWLRALLLERERIANHLGDLGSLGNDGGLAFGLAQFSRMKEVDLDTAGADSILAEADRLEDELRTLRSIYYDHAGLQDRCINCGRLSPRTAAALGVVGLAARASGHAIDARVFPGHAPYGELGPRLCSHRNGDVAARIVVRFEEAFESLDLQRKILHALPSTPTLTRLPEIAQRAFGIGWIEGWRGEVLLAVEADADGRIRRCHPHDPSWQNWPALEHAVIGNIVPDFPLINKSFNLSYAGADL